MKILVPCMQCNSENRCVEFLIADYFDNGVANVKCSVGHQGVVMLQSRKFEMLLDSGAIALLQEFTLEACVSFYTALERFYEFTTKVLCKTLNMSDELFEAMLKPMSKQSERQLGAFMLLHALVFEEAYKQPDVKISKRDFIKFRNDIIHNGFIPTKEEAHEFCATIYTEIQCLFNKLSKKDNNAIIKVHEKEMWERGKKIPPEIHRSTMSNANFFHPQHSFDEALNSFQEWIPLHSIAQHLNSAAKTMYTKQ